MSCLLYRHTIFVGSPVVPLLALVHERRPKESHQLLFSWFQKLTSVSRITLVADREQAITKALDTVLPESTVVYCWNHILGDARVSMFVCAKCLIT